MIMVFEMKTKGIQGNRAMVQPFSNMVNTINYTLVLMFEVQKKGLWNIVMGQHYRNIYIFSNRNGTTWSFLSTIYILPHLRQSDTKHYFHVQKIF